VVNTSSADLWRSLDSLMDRAHIFASVETIHGRAELVEELAPRLAAVKAADVAEAAADLLSQHRALLELQPAGN
jgi:predicted Zn-dependent peptidase